ncbi:MAG: HAD hydrolase-like protein [Rickettsiales bacterium]|jgi:HAD superfamily hydrolase (TIGR01450 family)|nr:HAD hydrolase-like protein [Rickettsiales bacterium]
MQIYNNILSLKDKFDIFLFDAYGVFWDGSQFYEGSKEAMKYLADNGKTVCVLSNNTSLAKEYEISLEKKGLNKGIHYHEMITSGEAARQSLEKRNLEAISGVKKVYQFGTPRKLFDGLDYIVVDNLKEANLAYLSVPQFTEDERDEFVKAGYGNYLHESKLPKEGEPRKWDSTKLELFDKKIEEVVKSGLPILNANPDLTANEGAKGTEEKHFVIRQGSIAEELKKRGAKVIELGKPEKEIYDFTFEILKKFGKDISNKARIVMIGDTLRTDIRGANNAGIQSVLCIDTGVTASELKKGKKLEDLIKEENVKVDYFIRGVGFDIINNNLDKMTEKFELVPGLAKKDYVTDLKLSVVLFENNKLYPWVFLVPKKAGVKNMTYLTVPERLQLMKEMAAVEKVMATLFPHDQTNVAMIGNKTPQLHVHILCRKDGDPDWPGTVWGNAKEPYASEEEKKAVIEKIKRAVEEEIKKPEYN